MKLEDSYYMNMGWDLMFELSYDEGDGEGVDVANGGQFSPKSWALYHHFLGTAQAEDLMVDGFWES